MGLIRLVAAEDENAMLRQNMTEMAAVILQQQQTFSDAMRGNTAVAEQAVRLANEASKAADPVEGLVTAPFHLQPQPPFSLFL